MTTLEKIRAEIYEHAEQMHFNGEFYIKVDEVLKIIDKYASEECDNDCEHCAYIECPKEPCEDAVSRQAVLKEFEKGTENLYGRIDKLPSVQPKAKTGHWIEREVRGDLALYCSECEAGLDVYYHYSFCPNCGAKMVEPQESE